MARSFMINIFTPSFADEADTNAQNLTVKEIVARLCPDRFRVMMCCEGLPDPRISARRNTKLLRWQRHGNTPRALLHLLVESPEIFFFPLDRNETRFTCRVPDCPVCRFFPSV